MKSDQSNQTKPSSKDSEIEEVNHLDNDKEEQTVADIFKLRNPTGYSLGHFDKHIEAIDQYTQSKLKAFAGEFEKAIGEEIMCYDSTDISHKFMSCDTCQSNMKNYELRQALKAIKERWNI